jgi:hypothetical protein
MTNQQKIIKTKVGILELAKQLGNVSQACKVMGYSRDSFYRFKTLYDTGGEAALQEISKQKPNRKNRVDSLGRKGSSRFRIPAACLRTTAGEQRIEKKGVFVSPGGVRSIWLRHDLATFKGRLKALEAKMAQENLILTESQLAALKRAKEEKEAHGEIETEHPGYLGAQDTYYVGNIKGVGHIYQQTFIDTYTKVAFCKLYDRKNALVAADMLNDKVIPFFDSQGIPLLRILTDRGSEYCGNREHHEYALYLDLENIDHSRTKARSPQSNGICERFNKTCKDEFYSVAFRKKVYRNINEIQLDLDEWVWQYNHERTYSGKYCYGKTPMQTFTDSIPLAKEKLFGYDISDRQSA